MDQHEQLNRDAARMVGTIESILNHEREMTVFGLIVFCS